MTTPARIAGCGLGFAAAVAVGVVLFVRTAFPFSVSPGPIALNYVENTPRISSAGMPTQGQFASIAGSGFGTVVNLAPDDALGAHRDERALAEAQGLRYVHVPIDFMAPSVADYERVAAALRDSADRRVLVHCQISLRASTFVFLYRVIELGEDPDTAFDDVARVWQPSLQWRAFIREVLGRYGKAVPMEVTA
jgi:protein tyrosine phosphatase (PTP) superfamily phosphohydrolase (DUF442 family)